MELFSIVVPVSLELSFTSPRKQSPVKKTELPSGSGMENIPSAPVIPPESGENNSIKTGSISTWSAGSFIEGLLQEFARIIIPGMVMRMRSVSDQDEGVFCVMTLFFQYEFQGYPEEYWPVIAGIMKQVPYIEAIHTIGYQEFIICNKLRVGQCIIGKKIAVR